MRCMPNAFADGGIEKGGTMYPMLEYSGPQSTGGSYGAGLPNASGLEGRRKD